MSDKTKAKTFRQTVEDIVCCTQCPIKGAKDYPCSFQKGCQEQVNRICEAHKADALKMADELGNEKIKSSKPLGNMEIGFNQGMQNCQAYLRKQVE